MLSMHTCVCVVRKKGTGKQINKQLTTTTWRNQPLSKCTIRKIQNLFGRSLRHLLSTFNMLGLFDMFDISIMYGFIFNNVKYADISVPITQTHHVCTTKCRLKMLYFSK